MADGLNSLYFGIGIVLTLSTLPLMAIFYGYYWSGMISLILTLSLSVIYFWIRYFVPMLLKTLIKISQGLSPIANYLNNTKVLGPIISWCIRATFFFWFIVLLMSDVIIRVILSKVSGIHEGTGIHYSPVNASDTNFQPLGSFNEEEEQNKQLYGDDFPKYDKKLASSLAMASKIAYEDVPIIKCELEKAGYDMNSFKPIAYKNVCGYIVEKGDNIIIVFRGSNPLNIQNWLTDIRALLCNVSSRGLMCLVHEGFYEAIGEDLPVHELSRYQSQTTIELSNTSLVKTVETIFSALKTLIFFAFQSITTHIYDPVDHRYLGEDARFISVYSQAEKWVSKLCKETDDEEEMEKNNKNNDSRNVSDDGLSDIRQLRGKIKSKKRLYITGHSLGGGLAIVFLFKLLKNDSSLLDILAGIYTYGQPNVGDLNFAKAFGPKLGKKIFYHAYNNDAVTRVPRWNPYSNPPGNLVFIDSSFSMYIYPPDPITNVPIPIRRISFLHLSGLLNVSVIKRMRSESWLRIFIRMMFPFFINDHFPGDYVRAIREGTIKRIIFGLPGQVGGLENHDMNIIY